MISITGGQILGNEHEGELRALYRNSQLAQILFDHLAGRKRDTKELTTVHAHRLAAAQGLASTDAKIWGFFKALEKIGVGTKISGRRGKPSRFRWGASAKLVAQCAKNGPRQVAVSSDQAGGVSMSSAKQFDMIMKKFEEVLDALSHLSEFVVLVAGEATDNANLAPPAPPAFGPGPGRWSGPDGPAG